ncbi:unnamed protein product [Urochloa humidicola]
MAAPAPKPPPPPRPPAARRLHAARCLPDPPPPPPAPAARPALLSLLSAVPDWADAVQERRVRDRRPLYDHASWREHRSSRRHLRHFLSSLSSRVILSLAPPVAAFTAFAAAIATYNTLLPAYALTASSLPYQLTAPALALLLVFRTEASYARFDEGRKAWMRVLAGAADLAGMVMHRPAAQQADDEPLRRALLNYILAFPVALKCHILSDSDVETDLQGLLAQDDLTVVLASKHRPRCIIEFISQTLQILDLDEQKRSIMESVCASSSSGFLFLCHTPDLLPDSSFSGILRSQSYSGMNANGLLFQLPSSVPHHSSALRKLVFSLRSPSPC